MEDRQQLGTCQPAAGPISPPASSFCSWHRLSLAQAVLASPDTPHSLLGTVARTKSLSSTYPPRGLPLGQKELRRRDPEEGKLARASFPL